MASCIKCTTAEEALKTLDEYADEVDSMLIDGKIVSDRGTMIIVKSKTKNLLQKLLLWQTMTVPRLGCLTMVLMILFSSQ